MMLALAPFALAAVALSTSPAEPAQPPAEALAPVAAPFVAELRLVPLTDIVYAAADVDLNLRMNELGLVGSTGLFGAPQQVSSRSAAEDCAGR